MVKIHKMAISAASLLGLVVLTANVPSFANSFSYHHPRRAEVLRRDNVLNREVNHDYVRLHGHFGQLKHEDWAIRRQEQRDARINGGYITRGQQAQLNREENHVQRQINRHY